MQQFRDGTVKVLIATDVSARGIDIPDVDYVVNYDLPDVAENYVHRVGRTGRGTKKGLAVSFCSAEERPILDEIESFLQQPIQKQTIHKDEYSDTLVLHDDRSDKMKALMAEIEEQEKWERKKRRKS
jgi:ATP-dependent RNA helicase RhlE